MLSKPERKALPAKDFAGKNRSFPVNDKAHAKAAILDSKYAPPSERAAIKAKAKKVLENK
jgi:hypothetical protein